MKKIKIFIISSVLVLNFIGNTYSAEQNECQIYQGEYETEDLSKLFENVTYNQPKVKVRKCDAVETKGYLEVHFNNVNQIIESLNKPVNLKAKGKIWYFKDLEEGNNIQYVSDQKISHSPCLYIEGKKGLIISGSLELTQNLIFPKNSDLNGLSLKQTEAGHSTLHQKRERKEIIKILSNFDDNLFKTRTKDASALTKIVKERDSIEDQKKWFLSDFCDELYMVYNGKCNERVTDVINASKPYAVISKTKEEFYQLKSEIALGDSYFRLILPKTTMIGIYSIEPIFLIELHKLICEGDLFLTGKIKLPKSSLKIKAKNNIWCMGLSIYSGQSISIKSGASLNMYGFSADLLQRLGTEMPYDMFISYVKHLLDEEIVSPQFANILTMISILSEQAKK